MSEYTKDLFKAVIEPLFLEQYKASVLFKKLVEALVKPISDVYHSTERVRNLLQLRNGDETVSGSMLDALGALKNVKRKAGESDEDFEKRIEIKFRTKDAGTPNNIIANTAFLSGDNKPQYLDEIDSSDEHNVTFFVYTPNGRQLYRSEVQDLAPAGVLGVPAVALKFTNGAYIKPVESSKKFLAVGNDSRIGSGWEEVVSGLAFVSCKTEKKKEEPKPEEEKEPETEQDSEGDSEE